jgi:tetratricopeptide (TPR) repeat protein
MGRLSAKETKRRIGCVIAAFFIFSFLACVPAGSFHYTRVQTGYEEEERLLLQRSEAEQRLIEEQWPVYEDEQLEHYLTELARSLQPPEVLARIPFRVTVLRDISPDALSFPDGRLYLTTGMVAQLENEAQLAILLAHEMTHCIHRHALRALRHVKEGALGRGGLSEAESALSWHNALPPLETYLGELESEADTVGLQLVVRAGYDAAEGWKLLERQQRALEEGDLDEVSRVTRYRDLEKRKEFWHKLLDAQAEGPRPRITRRETFLAHAHRVILDTACADETRGRFTLAQREVESYLAIRPDDARAYYLLGEICRQRGLLGDGNKAKDCYTRAIDLQPSFPEPHRGMGLVYYKEGEKARAKSSFEAYLIYAPDAPDKAYIQGYISTCN